MLRKRKKLVLMDELPAEASNSEQVPHLLDTMDLDQALDFFHSPLAVALLAGCAETISAKETGEGFRLGRLFF